MNSVLSEFPWRPMPLAACSRPWSKDLAWAGVFAKSARSSVYSYRIFLNILNLDQEELIKVILINIGLYVNIPT